MFRPLFAFGIRIPLSTIQIFGKFVTDFCCTILTIDVIFLDIFAIQSGKFLAR